MARSRLTDMEVKSNRRSVGKDLCSSRVNNNDSGGVEKTRGESASVSVSSSSSTCSSSCSGGSNNNNNVTDCGDGGRGAMIKEDSGNCDDEDDGDGDSGESETSGEQHMVRKGTVIERLSRTSNINQDKPGPVKSSGLGDEGALDEVIEASKGQDSNPADKSVVVEQVQTLIDKKKKEQQQQLLELEKHNRDLATALSELATLMGLATTTSNNNNKSTLLRNKSNGEGEGEKTVSSPELVRTIPFRSASFSQVELTSEGNYVRIALKPSAFCLAHTNYPSLPRSISAQNSTPRGVSDTLTEETCSAETEETESLSMAESAQEPQSHRNVEVTPTESEDAKIMPGNKEAEKTDKNLETTKNSTSTLRALLVGGEEEQFSGVSLPSGNNDTVNNVGADAVVSDGSSRSEGKLAFSSSRSSSSSGGGVGGRGGAGSIMMGALGTSSSSEDADAGGVEHEASVPQSPPPPQVPSETLRKFVPEKARMAFKLGLTNKQLPLLALDGVDAGCGSEDVITPTTEQVNVSSTGDNKPSENCTTTVACTSPTTLSPTNSISGSTTVTNSSDTANGSSLPPSSSGYKYYYHRSSPSSPPVLDTPTSSPPSSTSLFATSAGASSTSSTPCRRYYKRPLRGPYGQMLEAEMNKVLRKSLNKELMDFTLDSIFQRESKSSSPPPYSSMTTPNSHHHSGIDASSVKTGLFMASAEDISSAVGSGSGKHSAAGSSTSPRCRKTAVGLTSPPILPSYSMPAGSSPGGSKEKELSVGGGSGILPYHQRTASSPSQLLYTGSSGGSGETTGTKQMSSSVQKRRPLDATPRGHVLAELVETERSYVESLRILVKKYMEPLKAQDIIDTGLVDEIFFQIPTILYHHERSMELLQRRVIDDQISVGDILLDTFRQNTLLECYSLFVNNWKNAKGSLKMAVASKPLFAKFIENNARQHKGKLTIDSLLIMPIQRIPRYELMVKELIKHTELTHDDHSRLILVLDKIKQFAVHIDCASVSIEPMSESGRGEIEIEGWTAGIGHLVNVSVVSLLTPTNVRKERALFLFADSIVIASIKKKSTIRKTSGNQYQPGGGGAGSTGAFNLEGCKFKLLLKLGLSEVLVDSSSTGSNEGDDGPVPAMASTASSSSSGSAQDETHEDLKTIHKIMDLATLLKIPHGGLDDVLRDLVIALSLSSSSSISVTSSSKQHCDSNNNAEVLTLEVRPSSSSNGDQGGEAPEQIKIQFSSPEKKHLWLESFHNTLAKYLRYGSGRYSQTSFVQAVPIRKTRAGLQLSCAVPVSLVGSNGQQRVDVWVANSDGYVGQICILTLHPEPSVTSCNGVCNSRITCILAVPPFYQPDHAKGSSRGERSPSSTAASTSPEPAFGEDETGEIHSKGRSGHNHHHHHPHHHGGGSSGKAEHWTVWLGTEDGALQIYDCSDSVRVKKSRKVQQHKSPLNAMAYYGGQVFVSLGSGDVAVYSRNNQGKGWLINEPTWITIGSGMNPVTRMLVVTTSTQHNQRQTLWAVTGTQIKVYSTSISTSVTGDYSGGGGTEGSNGMLELLHIVGGDLRGSVSNLVASDDAVWVALNSSSLIKCYNSTTYDFICHVDVASEVAKILSGCDDIIRQHKSACLRVTALLIAPDKSLWIGTSAGVILTCVTSPPTSSPGAKKLVPLALPQGHTGQVRVLTSCTSRDGCVVISGGDGFEEFRPPFFAPPTLTSTASSATLVSSSSVGGGGNSGSSGAGNLASLSLSSTSALSSPSSSASPHSAGVGGGGMTGSSIESMVYGTLMGGGGSRSISTGDLCGREDSTNHLLIWKVPRSSTSSSSSSSSTSTG